MPDDPRATRSRGTAAGDRAVDSRGLLYVMYKDKGPPRNKMDWAVDEFRKVKNPLLIQHGQFYWRKLAEIALGDFPPKCQKWKDLKDPRIKTEGDRLFRALWRNYLQKNGPRTGKELADWFKKTGHPITSCDHQALMAACIDKCFDTVNLMIQLIHKVCAFPVRGKSHLHLNNASAVKALAARPSGWPGVLEDIKKTLDNGYLLRAQVGPRHALLIFGHDGLNTLIYWNTVPDYLDPYGQGFGEIKFEQGNNAPIFGLPKRAHYTLTTLVPLAGSRCRH